MNVTHILVTRSDRISIYKFYHSDDYGTWVRQPTPTNIIGDLSRLPWWDNQPWEFIDPAVIPTDRTFRAAWVRDAGGVSVDMEKAVEVHKDTLRKVRAPLLQALDIEMMTAWAKGDTKTAQEVEAKKQALRDVTDDPRIEAATTPDELKAVVPEVLSVEAVKAR